MEQDAIDVLAEEGIMAFHVENTLFNTLFGLSCWELIYSPRPGAFHHPYQLGPSDLFESEFIEANQAAFEAALGRPVLDMFALYEASAG